MSPKHITESVLADEFGVVTFYPHKQPTVYNVRKYSQHVNFAEAFSTHPVVTVALSFLIVHHEKDIRLSTLVRNVGTSGFNLGVQEWFDSNVEGVGISWLACSSWPSYRGLSSWHLSRVYLFAFLCFDGFAFITTIWTGTGNVMSIYRARKNKITKNPHAQNLPTALENKRRIYSEERSRELVGRKGGVVLGSKSDSWICFLIYIISTLQFNSN